MLDSLEQLRKYVNECTQRAGVEDWFETVCMTKSVLLENLDAIEREVEERYVKGPTDKNGDPITYDTMIEQWGVLDYIGCKMHPDGTYEWFVRGHDLSAPVLSADEVSIVKPPTVEDVLREFTDVILEWTGEWSDVAADFVKRLQLKEEQ